LHSKDRTAAAAVARILTRYEPAPAPAAAER
jgi:hypothetical protein